MLFKSWLNRLFPRTPDGRLHNRRRRRPRRQLANQLEPLEDRSLLSISFNPTSGAVNIVGTTGADVVQVSSPTADVLRAAMTNSSGTESQEFALADVH